MVRPKHVKKAKVASPPPAQDEESSGGEEEEVEVLPKSKSKGAKGQGGGQGLGKRPRKKIHRLTHSHWGTPLYSDSGSDSDDSASDRVS